MISKHSIAILGINRHFSKEHRIRNEVQSLGVDYFVDGYGEAGVEGLRNFHIIKRPQRSLYRLIKAIGGAFPRLRVRFESAHYKNIALGIRAKRYHFLIPHYLDDAVIAMDSGVPFVFHSHEYLPRQFDGSLLFRLTETRYRRYVLKFILRAAAAIVVEGAEVCSHYVREFGIPPEKFVIMPSMPAYRNRFSGSRFSRDVFNLIHHGLLVPERGVELLMDVAAELGPTFHLTLLGPGPQGYVNELQQRALRQRNVTISDPVPYDNIVETIHGADLGLIIFGSPHYHHQYTTVPNKFWECLQARVPVLVSPRSAMAAYVRESGCGMVAESRSIEGYINAIRNLGRESLESMKRRCEEKAWEHSRDSWLPDYAMRLRNAIDDETPYKASFRSSSFRPSDTAG